MEPATAFSPSGSAGLPRPRAGFPELSGEEATALKVSRLMLVTQASSPRSVQGVQGMTLNATPWNVQDYLKTPEDCVAYIEAAIEEAGDDPAFIAKALGDVVEALRPKQVP